MRHSQSNAYRGTDLTIVAIALACASVVAAVGIFSRVSTLDGGSRDAGDQPTMLSSHCQPPAECDRVAPAPGASRPIQLFGAGGGG